MSISTSEVPQQVRAMSDLRDERVEIERSRQIRAMGCCKVFLLQQDLLATDGDCISTMAADYGRRALRPRRWTR
jgi:hypothetical protein